MKYMLMMHYVDFGVPQITEWAPEEIKAHIGFMGEVYELLQTSGELVAAEGLSGPDLARIVRSTDSGTPAITDGPFPEAKEFLAGFWIVDVESDARAVELANHISAAPGPGGKPINMPIEVRPIMAAPSID